MKRILLIVFFLISSSLAVALPIDFNNENSQFIGPVSGGGGAGVLCRDSNGGIKSLNTLDLYEAKYLFGFDIQKDDSHSPMKQATDAVNSIYAGANLPSTAGLKPAVLASLVKINKNKIVLNGNNKPKPIDDADTILELPQNCQLVQIAHFRGANQLVIDGNLWKRLSNTKKASLLLHETVYKLERNFGQKTPRRSRKLVAFGFARAELTSAAEGLPKDAWICFRPFDKSATPIAQWYAFNNKNGHLVFQFEILEGQFMVSKTTVIHPFNIHPSQIARVATMETFVDIDSEFDDDFSIAYRIGESGPMLNVASQFGDLKYRFTCQAQ